MKKQFMEDMKGLFFALLPWLIVIGVIALACFLAYKISVSDLPPWFKFWLLSGR